MRNRPQRNPLHRFTVDRHLVECAANAAALTRDVSRPDLLLLAALLHDIGKGWPGDHSVSGEVVARDVARGVGLERGRRAAGRRRGPPPPAAARRRDPARPGRPGDRGARRGDGRLADPARAAARAGRGRRARHRPGGVERLEGGPGRRPGPPGQRRAGRRAHARARPAARGPARARRRRRPGRDRQAANEVTVVALDRPGLLWRAAGVLASHRLVVRGANASSVGDTAVTVFSVVPEYGDPPDADAGHRGPAPDARGQARRGGPARAPGAARPGRAGSTGAAAEGHPGRRRVEHRHRGGGPRARRARACCGASAGRSATAG